MQVIVFSACLAGGLVGCAFLAPPSRPPERPRDTADPYGKALQQALVRQHFSRVHSADKGYRIGAHDVLDIRVFGYDKMNIVTRVGGNGMINFSPLGDLQAAGLTDRQLEAVLQDRLRGKYLTDPHVTVFVKEAQASEVALVGAVQKPGRYLLMGEKNLVDLLTEAGGMTEKAGTMAYIIRFPNRDETNPGGDGLRNPPPSDPLPAETSPTLNDGAQRIKIDLDRLLLHGEEQLNIAIMPGDLINIPEAGSVHVTGTGVKEPGTFPLTRSTKTLLQIVDEAEGLKFEAADDLLILRKGEDGIERSIRVSYRRIVRDTRNDIILRAGDVIVTRRTPVKTVLASIGKAFNTLIRIGVYGTWSVPIG